jgi:hypothetical protein
MGNLTDDQRQIIRNTLALLAEERIRIRRMIDESVVSTIKLDEVERKFGENYNDLRRLLKQDEEAALT